MPLMKRRSKKAFEHNVKAEMHAGKPQDQALAISYSVKRRAKKANGGPIGDAEVHRRRGESQDSLRNKRNVTSPAGNIEASNRAAKHAKNPNASDPRIERSMAREYKAKAVEGHKQKLEEMKAQPKPKLPMAEGGFIDPQAYSSASANQRPGKLPIKHPRIVKGASFSSRLRDEEDDLEMSARPNNGPEHQPPHEDDEMGPDRQGPKVRDMQDEHSTHRKPYAKGGEVEQSDYSHPENECEDDLLDLPPSEDEGDMYAEEHDEEGQDRQGPDDEALHMKMMAEGGMMDNEEEIEHAASIAAAIMAKKRRKMAEGGQVDIESNGAEEPNAYYGRNEAALKENYDEDMEDVSQPEDSNEHSPEHDEEDVDDADIVSAIRRKMRMRSKITK